MSSHGAVTNHDCGSICVIWFWEIQEISIINLIWGWFMPLGFITLGFITFTRNKVDAPTKKNVVETCRIRFLPCRTLQNLQYGFNWQPQAQQNGFPSTQLVWDTLLNIHVFTGAYFTHFFTRSKTLILYHPMCLCQMTRWIPPLNHKVYWLHPQELLLGTPR